MVNPKRFYTYAYLRKDKTPYYIGKGSGKRAYYKWKGQIKPPRDKSRIIFLKQNLTEEEAFKHEKYMIAVFGRKDIGTGILHNKTDGADGCSGVVITEEYIQNKIRGGKRSKELGKGIHGRTKEQMIEDGRKGVEKQKELGLGVYGKNKEKYIEFGKFLGNKTKELGIGIHGLSKEERRKNGKKGAQKAKELGIGLYGLTKEERSENGKKGGKKGGQTTYELGKGVHGMTKEQRSEHSKKVNSQKWMCLETGFISTPGSLTNYQRNRGIDTFKRKRIS